MNLGFLVPGLLLLEVLLLVVTPLFANILIEPSGTGTSVLIATTIVGFLTMVVQQLFAAHTIRKTHEFEAADREVKAQAARDMLVLEIEKIKAESAMKAQEIIKLGEERTVEYLKFQNAQAAHTHEKLDKIAQATEDGNVAAQAAYSEANDINRKIARLSTARADELRVLVESTLTETRAGTIAADKAYQEANQVNNKIRDLQEQNVKKEGNGGPH